MIDPLWLNVAFGIAMTALTGLICEHKAILAWARRPWRQVKPRDPGDP